MTDTTFSPIGNGGGEAFSMNDLDGLTMAQLEAFISGYAQRLLDFCSMVDQIADGMFADSQFPLHLRITVPTLAIDLHFPMRITPVTLNDMFVVAVLLQLMERAATRIKEAITAASTPATSDYSDAMAKAVENNISDSVDDTAEQLAG